MQCRPACCAAVPLDLRGGDQRAAGGRSLPAQSCCRSPAPGVQGACRPAGHGAQPRSQPPCGSPGASASFTQWAAAARVPPRPQQERRRGREALRRLRPAHPVLGAALGHPRTVLEARGAMQQQAPGARPDPQPAPAPDTSQHRRRGGLPPCARCRVLLLPECSLDAQLSAPQLTTQAPRRRGSRARRPLPPRRSRRRRWRRCCRGRQARAPPVCGRPCCPCRRASLVCRPPCRPACCPWRRRGLQPSLPPALPASCSSPSSCQCRNRWRQQRRRPQVMQQHGGRPAGQAAARPRAQQTSRSFATARTAAASSCERSRARVQAVACVWC